jgi:prevent-host-death family protein
MRQHLTVTEAVRNFSEVLGRVRFRGERFVLTKGGKPIAELVPVEEAPAVRLGELPGILAGLPHLDPADAGAFERDLDEARKLAGSVPGAPWAS